jgi:hypothetical protein
MDRRDFRPNRGSACVGFLYWQCRRSIWICSAKLPLTITRMTS